MNLQLISSKASSTAIPKRLCFVLVVMVLISHASQAKAATITYNISGQIAAVFASPFGIIDNAFIPGALWSGQVTWETGQTDLNPGDPNRGEFVSPFGAGIFLSIDAAVPGGIQFINTFPTGGVALTAQLGDPGLSDTFFTITSTNQIDVIPPLPPQIAIDLVSVDFLDIFSSHPGIVFPADIPSSIDLLDFPESSFVIRGRDASPGGGDFDIIGTIFTATLVVVPEPTTFAILLLGVLALTRFRREGSMFSVL